MNPDSAVADHVGVYQRGSSKRVFPKGRIYREVA